MTDDEIAERREQSLTDEVVASFDGAPDERYRQVMSALVRHLHNFAREVRLTEPEWDNAIDFLTRAGEITDKHRQEFILLSDVLGLSMLTVAINSTKQRHVTEATVFGPFFVHEAPMVEHGGDIAGSMPGLPCHIAGTVTDIEGRPIPGARIEVWGADDDGYYDVQYEGAELRGRAHLFAGNDGSYDFWTVQPAPYPIPHDGPVGVLLEAARRSPMRPAHVHFMVTAPGYERLVTHIFVAGDEWLGSDAVFGVKSSLVVPFDRHPAGAGPGGRHCPEGWSSARFEIVLASSTTT